LTTHTDNFNFNIFCFNLPLAILNH